MKRLLTIALLLAASRIHAQGPSFDCARVTSAVNKLICATPALAALDLQLANDFASVRAQGGIDPRALDADEAHWLKSVRNVCATVACLTDAYTARDQALLRQSQRAASPAAYSETRPFPAPPAAAAAAQSLLGRPCSLGRPFPGFSSIAGFLTITGNGTYVVPLGYHGTRFAFLFTYPSSAEGSRFDQCVVSDVLALPAAAPHQAFLQCSLELDGSHGFGIRQAGAPGTLYWMIDTRLHKLRREPLGVLGNAQPRCQEPETGD